MKKILLKVLSIFLIVIIAIVAIALLVIEVYPRVNDSVEIGTFEGATDWMSAIDDNVLLSDINIPGVHDAGSNDMPLTLFSKCQDSTVYEQLNAGYRYFDIRLGVDYVCGEPMLLLYHGFVNCKNDSSIFAGNLYFDAVVEQMVAFLDEHPSESIVFVVKQEHGDESVAEFQSILNSYVGDKDFWLLTDKMPTLAESRGKIVLFRRYADEAGLKSNAGIPLIWTDQRDNSDVSKSYELNENEGLSLLVQDRFKYDTADKWNAFIDTADNASNADVIVNFLSTNGTPAYGHPYKYAKQLNSKLIESKQSFACPQWIIVDFCTAEIAEMIIAQN